MAYNVSALTAYTDEQRLPLITKLVFGSKTASLLQKQVGIKSSAQLNLFDTDAVFQSAESCGWTASGTTAFTRRELAVGKIKVQEALCVRTLENHWMQTQLTAGSNYDSIPFEQEYTEQKANRIAAQLETAIWQGDTATSNTNPVTNKFDGFLKLLNVASGSVVSGNTSAVSAITVANIESIMDTQYARIPAEVINRNDIVTFMGWDTFRTLIMAIKNSDFNHFAPEGATNGEMVYPGTNMRVIAVHGLNGTNRIVTSYVANMYYGTDLLSDEEQFRIWHSLDNDEIRFQAFWKAGVQFAYPQFIVDFKLA